MLMLAINQGALNSVIEWEKLSGKNIYPRGKKDCSVFFFCFFFNISKFLMRRRWESVESACDCSISQFSEGFFFKINLGLPGFLISFLAIFFSLVKCQFVHLNEKVSSDSVISRCVMSFSVNWLEIFPYEQIVLVTEMKVFIFEYGLVFLWTVTLHNFCLRKKCPQVSVSYTFAKVTHILRDPGAASQDHKKFVVKVY